MDVVELFQNTTLPVVLSDSYDSWYVFFVCPCGKKKLEQILKIFGECFKFRIETYSVEQYK